MVSMVSMVRTVRMVGKVRTVRLVQLLLLGGQRAWPSVRRDGGCVRGVDRDEHARPRQRHLS